MSQIHAKFVTSTCKQINTSMIHAIFTTYYIHINTDQTQIQVLLRVNKSRKPSPKSKLMRHKSSELAMYKNMNKNICQFYTQVLVDRTLCCPLFFFFSFFLNIDFFPYKQHFATFYVLFSGRIIYTEKE
jgi:hypothetical protein